MGQKTGPPRRRQKESCSGIRPSSCPKWSHSTLETEQMGIHARWSPTHAVGMRKGNIASWRSGLVLSPKNDPVSIRDPGQDTEKYVLTPISNTYLVHQCVFSYQDLLCFYPGHTRGAGCPKPGTQARSLKATAVCSCTHVFLSAGSRSDTADSRTHSL